MALAPRLDPDEIEYLKDFMANKPDGSTMVEWGSGGSTTLFAPYFKTGRFVSIEHNFEWFEKVSEELRSPEHSNDYLKNFLYAYIPPAADIKFYGYGVPYEENPCFAKNYISPQIMDDGEMVDIWGSDIFFVDGICRGAILATIRAKATKLYRSYDPIDGKWTDPASIFVHDFYGPEKREVWYSWSSSLFSKVERVGSTLAKITL